MTAKKLISREEVLGGMRGKSTKQANTLLALIENRTAHLMVQAQQPVGLVLTETALAERSQAFLEAVAVGREPPVQPTIRDLERYAPQWAILAPDNPSIRATVAHLLGQKYDFTSQATPGLQTALGLDTDVVQQAYQRLYQNPLESIYAPQVTRVDQLRWRWTAIAKWLDALPPFWVAFMLTLIIGGVTLAVPIAAAGIGALPSVALIIIFGLINMVTISAMAETVTRSASIRYGNAFIGRVVAELLGNTSSAILSIVLTAFSFGLLLIFYIGISTTLEGSTGLPAEAWMVALFLVGLYFLSRGSLNVTVAFTMVIGAINLGLLLVLSLLAFTQLNLDNLLYINVPLLSDQPFDPSILSAIVGVILGTYSAHILVAVFGKMTLQRDPSGRSTVRGHAAGIGCAMIVNTIWVLAVNGAIPPQVLANQPGTALVPLTAQIGPVVGAIGAIFAILSMGLGLIHFTLALFNLAKERLSPQQITALGRQGTFLVSLSPVILVFLVAQWLSFTNSGSFAGILGFLGVIVDSLMAGIFPVLLLATSRRKAELVPNVVYRFLGNPILLTGIYLLFLFNLLFHGLIIWQNPIQRAGGVLVGLLMLGATIAIFRQGAFAPRVVVELRKDERKDGDSLLSVVAGGEPCETKVDLVYDDQAKREVQAATVPLPTFSKLRSVHLQPPPTPAKSLKIWGHSITPEGEADELSAVGTVHFANERQDFDLKSSGGQVVMSLANEPYQLDITLPEPATEKPARLLAGELEDDT